MGPSHAKYTFLSPKDACKGDSPTFEELEEEEEKKRLIMSMSMTILNCHMKSIGHKKYSVGKLLVFIFWVSCRLYFLNHPPSHLLHPTHLIPKTGTPATIANQSSPALSLTPYIFSAACSPTGTNNGLALAVNIVICHPISIRSFSLIVFPFPQCWQPWWSVNQCALFQLIQVEGFCPKMGTSGHGLSAGILSLEQKISKVERWNWFFLVMASWQDHTVVLVI